MVVADGAFRKHFSSAFACRSDSRDAACSSACGSYLSKTVIPVVRKITSRTDYKWDDYLLSDKILSDACALAGPVVVYVLLLIGLPDYAIADFLMKFCRIYIIAMFIRLACSIISSVYVMSSEHDRLKNHSMKGFYQMLKLAVICVGTIVIVSILVDKNPTVDRIGSRYSNTYVGVSRYNQGLCCRYPADCQ